MSGRVRRALPGFLPRALAGLWAVLLVLAGTSGAGQAGAFGAPGTVPAGTAGAAGAASGPLGPGSLAASGPAAATSGPGDTAYRPSSAAPQALSAHSAPAHSRADARTAPDRPVARQSATAHVHGVLPHPRSPGLPGALPSAAPTPHRSPFGYGETVGPRQERAPPGARYSPRSPRAPPFVRSS
ncbi:hypothetical protein CP973_32645 [Streptomyces albofaciens JCM 4342]|uniref:hypothetical protein n=1 Tax=Streptomyces albofaciens TaxID=66866 RepID=UPI00123AF788|nr:hypothetical protein [Streptomyces albofaciens]KAA6213922.1 hypothetical protein CP973_32645 [Streptomyces albofaciens JCM 4342]